MAELKKLSSEEFENMIASVDQNSFASNIERKKAAALASQLLSRLETPMEKSARLLNVDTFLIAAVKTLLDLDLFSIWDQAGRQPQTVQELAALTNAQPELIERLVRMLAVSGLLGVDKEDRYLFTDVAQSIAKEGYHHLWLFHTQAFQVCASGLPEYFKATGYRNPSDFKESFWAWKTGELFVDYLVARPEILTNLNGLMKIKNNDNVPWFTYFPIEELVKRCVPMGTLLVDIGGGTGSDISILNDFLPEKLGTGQLVLQDLPSVTSAAPTMSPAITVQAHDFFNEQPIKGAAAYYLHNVLHDWPDEKCRAILARTKEAMKLSYSRLLINENVLTSESTPRACAADLLMMAANSGSERTAAHWNSLLVDSGFKIIKIWKSPVADQSIIEAEPV